MSNHPTRLTILGKGSKSGYVVCRCACGAEKEIRLAHVRDGKIRSCGCLNQELRILRTTTHGKYYTPEHKTWALMLNRCRNPKATDYARYGGRGIVVCDRWQDSFEAFLEDMGPRPSARHSIDRVDNGGNYEPGNCRWATRVEQGRNKRNNVVLELDGQRRTVSEWAAITGIEESTIHFRLGRGWEVRRTLTERVGRWARLRCDACLGCGTTVRKHHARGYCRSCYERLERS